jgi:hypothetical protein
MPRFSHDEGAWSFNDLPVGRQAINPRAPAGYSPNPEKLSKGHPLKSGSPVKANPPFAFVLQ